MATVRANGAIAEASANSEIICAIVRPAGSGQIATGYTGGVDGRYHSLEIADAYIHQGQVGVEPHDRIVNFQLYGRRDEIS